MCCSGAVLATSRLVLPEPSAAGPLDEAHNSSVCGLSGSRQQSARRMQLPSLRRSGDTDSHTARSIAPVDDALHELVPRDLPHERLTDAKHNASCGTEFSSLFGGSTPSSGSYASTSESLLLKP